MVLLLLLLLLFVVVVTEPSLCTARLFWVGLVALPFAFRPLLFRSNWNNRKLPVELWLSLCRSSFGVVQPGLFIQ